MTMIVVKAHAYISAGEEVATALAALVDIVETIEMNDEVEKVVLVKKERGVIWSCSYTGKLSDCSASRQSSESKFRPWRARRTC